MSRVSIFNKHLLYLYFYTFRFRSKPSREVQGLIKDLKDLVECTYTLLGVTRKWVLQKLVLVVEGNPLPLVSVLKKSLVVPSSTTISGGTLRLTGVDEETDYDFPKFLRPQRTHLYFVLGPLVGLSQNYRTFTFSVRQIINLKRRQLRQLRQFPINQSIKE